MKKLSKVTLKLNNTLLTVLDTLAVELNEELTGFIKLEHDVKFDNFPASIFVSCYFKNTSLLNDAKTLETTYQKRLKALLLKKGILLKTMNHLQFIALPAKN